MPLNAMNLVLRGLLSTVLATAARGDAWCAPREVERPPEVVKIGLFVPTDGERAAEGLALRRGAETAVARANAEGGFQGRPFSLVLGSASDPWDGGTRELVRLIYDDQVWAVVGAVGGRSAHLAAQVVARAKGQVVFVTPAATDPSLTRIKLPWFFRLVPDDRQQAAALVREIFDFRGLKRVGLIVEEGYDSRTAASAFAKAAPANATVVFSVGQGQKENELIEHLRQSGAEGLVFFVRASTAAKWVRLLRGHGMSVPFFGPLGLAAADFERRAGSAAEGTVFVISNSPRGLETSQSLEWSPWESYGDDSVTVIVQAIRQGGLHRSAIREAVAGTEFVGLTGPIRFGPDGGRQGRARLGRLQERRLVALALR